MIEQFDGTSLNTNLWRTCFHNSMINSTCCNHDQAELEIYCPGNVSVSNGTLKLTATHDAASGKYYSGMIMSGPGPNDPASKFTFLYGHAEMRAKLPAGKGLWPAFWLLDPDTYPPEIDIMEVLDDSPTVYGTFHPASGGQNQGQVDIPNLFNDFHTYAIDWSPGLLVWSVDGKEYHRTTSSVPSSPMYIIVNLAVGGDWPGNPDASTHFPAILEVDSISVLPLGAPAMTTFGVDFSGGYSLSALKAAGVQFACQYAGFSDYTLPQDKIITYSRAYDLSVRGGLALVTNWEWTADRASLHNGFYNGNSSAAFKGGVDDAIAAMVLHKSIGGPQNRPIYFSVDYNTDGTDTDDYFKGLVSILGLSRVGAYGPYAAIKHLSDAGLISWRWQTYAWSGVQWLPNNHIQQYSNGEHIGGYEVDYDHGMVPDFGQWQLPASAPKPVWYQYPIVVPFGNPYYDPGLGGSHDLDVAPPPNMAVTSLVSGSVSDISAPDWGKQVGILLDSPINGIRYFHYLHLSATNPALSIGKRVAVGDVIGWVGGANTQGQYQGTANPTGQNFLNSTNSSSQIQVGIALMDGPAYGGSGWVHFPPIDMRLDPTPTILQARNTLSPVPGPLPESEEQMHFSYGTNDRDVFSTFGKLSTLMLATDFGSAQVRIAVKMANTANQWSVGTHLVNSGDDPLAIPLGANISKVSIVVSQASSPDTTVGVDMK